MKNWTILFIKKYLLSTLEPLLMLVVMSAGAAALIACSTAENFDYKIDERLLPAVLEFEKKYNVKIDFSVIINESLIHNEQAASGICHYWPDETGIKPYVEISKETLEAFNYDKFVVRQLVFHELGHCKLKLTHNDNVQNDIPVSIMNSTMFGHQPYYNESTIDYFDNSLIDFRAIPRED